MAERMLFRRKPAWKNPLSRRSFLKKVTELLGGITLMNCGLFPLRGSGVPLSSAERGTRGEKLIFVAIDGLRPRYFDLDSRGMQGGQTGTGSCPTYASS